MNRMRFKLAGSSRELVHQAIELIEDGWLQEQDWPGRKATVVGLGLIVCPKKKFQTLAK